MEAIFHFGMTKTGSTSIQSTLYGLPPDLPKDFLYFSPDDTVNCTRALKILYRDGMIRRSKRAKMATSLDVEQERLRRLLEAQGSHADEKLWIFSSEALVREQEVNIADLREYFLSAGKPPRSVGYVRPPKSFMESGFQQRVKVGQKHVPIRKIYPNYRELFEKFERVFGRDRVDYWPFDRRSLHNGCVVQDFAHRLGIEVPPQHIVRHNDGISKQALSLLFAYSKYEERWNGQDPDNMPSRNDLLWAISDLPGDKLHFHSSVIEPVLEEQRADIQWMEQRLGVSLREDLAIDDAIAIKSMEDLLNFSPETLKWLADKMDSDKLARRVMTGEPKAVANGVWALGMAGR